MNLPKNENTMRIIIRWSMIKRRRVVAAQWRAGPSWYCNTIWEALCLQINGLVSPLYLAGTSTQCHVAQPAGLNVRTLLSRVQYLDIYLLFPWKLLLRLLWLGLVLANDKKLQHRVQCSSAQCGAGHRREVPRTSGYSHQSCAIQVIHVIHGPSLTVCRACSGCLPG